MRCNKHCPTCSSASLDLATHVLLLNKHLMEHSNRQGIQIDRNLSRLIVIALRINATSKHVLNEKVSVEGIAARRYIL